MAIVYPLDMPAGVRMVSCVRELTRLDSYSPSLGATPAGTELGIPLWTATYQTTALTREQFSAWQAWLDSLRGPLGYFKAIHPATKYPLSRPQGFDGLVVAGTSTPFTGSGTIDNVSTTLSRIRLTGLPAAATWGGMRAGDVVSVAMSGQGRQLFRVIADSAGTATGLNSLIDLIPSVTSRIVNGAEYTILDPWFEAVIVPGSIQIQDTMDRLSLSFQARQVLR